MLLRFAPLVAVVLFLAGCGDERLPRPSVSDDPTAAAVAAALDRDCQAFAMLPPDRRAAAEEAFGPRLERDLATCRGTRYENIPLYLLANWTLAQGGDDAGPRAFEMLQRLQLLPSAAYHNFGRALMVQALLASGRLSEAKQQAAELNAAVPALGQQAEELVRFYEMVGSQAPPLPGVHAGGPAAAADGAFVLVVFLPACDAFTGRQVVPWTRLAAEAPDRLHVVVVSTGSDLLAAAAAAGEWGCAVRWIKPDDQAWIDSWRVPVTPACVLLGPGPVRTILAVGPSPGQVRQVLGRQR